MLVCITSRITEVQSHANGIIRYFVKHAMKCKMLHSQSLMKLLLSLKWRLKSRKQGIGRRQLPIEELLTVDRRRRPSVSLLLHRRNARQ